MISKKINSPLTSSLGRLFDGIAAIIGIRNHVSFEGQAAISNSNYGNSANISLISADYSSTEKS